ncbi:class I SAM-dependent methyltransferase [Chloroflexota bacterium]
MLGKVIERFSKRMRPNVAFRQDIPLSNLLSSLIARGRVLDIGAGRGWNMARLNSKGYEVVGIDVSLPRLEQASKHGAVIMASSDKLPFQDKSFDIVTSQKVLHHVQNPWQTVEEMCRVVKDNCLIFIDEVVEDKALLSLLRTIRPSWDSDPVKSRFTRSMLKEKLTNQGLVIIREDSFGGNIYWIWRVVEGHSKLLHRLTSIVMFIERQMNRCSNRFSSRYQVIALKTQ